MKLHRNFQFFVAGLMAVCVWGRPLQAQDTPEAPETPAEDAAEDTEDTAPQVANPSTLAAARADARATSPRHEPAKLARLAAKRQGEHVRVEWQVDPTMAPPFAYQLELHADGATAAPLSRLELTNPAARTAELPAAATGDAQVVRIRVRDLFDQWSPWQTLAVKTAE